MGRMFFWCGATYKNERLAKSLCRALRFQSRQQVRSTVEVKKTRSGACRNKMLMKMSIPVWNTIVRCTVSQKWLTTSNISESTHTHRAAQCIGQVDCVGISKVVVICLERFLYAKLHVQLSNNRWSCKQNISTGVIAIIRNFHLSTKLLLRVLNNKTVIFI